jgi:tetratricopeptide (TPR) repeat protein
MAYQEERRVRLKRQVGRQAITLATQGRWQESIVVNKNLIENFPNDIEAHNRLGKAYMELGDYAEARKAYNRALELDQYNTIARKNVERMTRLGDKAVVLTGNSSKAHPQLFIEEIGKAGMVNLHQLAPSETLVRTMAGDKVVLKQEGTSLAAENSQGEHLGIVPQKEASRLLKLMAGGNKYTAAVVSSSEDSISLMIRETYQDPNQMGIVSFPGRRFDELQPYVSDRTFRHEFGEEEDLGEIPGYSMEDELEMGDELGEEIEEDKDKKREQEV